MSSAANRLGPLRSGEPCGYRKPRLSPKYQARVGAFDPSKALPPGPPKKTRKPPFKYDNSEMVLWLPNRLSERTVESYLHFVKCLFVTQEVPSQLQQSVEKLEMTDYSEERALYFLHRCEYDVHKAKSMLSLKEAIIDEESESESEDNIVEEEDYCFVCSDGGSLILCDVDGCRKVYHLHCTRLQDVPSGKWKCPSHFCDVCKEAAPSASRCSYCPISYCKKHIPPELSKTEEDEIEFLCRECHAQKLSHEQRFTQRLHELMKRRGEPISRPPRIAGQVLDLYLLYKTVTQFGGAKKVSDNVQWSRVRDALQIPQTASNANSVIKTNYVKLLYPYEQLYFPHTLPLEDGVKIAKRRKYGKRKRRSPSATKGMYDVVFTAEYPDAFQIEMNVDGAIKHGVLFKNQIVTASPSYRPQMVSRISPRRSNFPHAETVQRVRSVMKRLQWTQTQLGKHIGCAQETISAFLNGRSTAARYKLPSKLRQWADEKEASLSKSSSSSSSQQTVGMKRRNDEADHPAKRLRQDTSGDN